MAFVSGGRGRGKTAGGLLGRLRRYFGDRRANVGVLTALLIIPLVGVMGVAGETTSWFFIQRSMQNAADSAALAASTNNTAVSAQPTYAAEAKSVAASYGFVDGANNTTVTVSANLAITDPVAIARCGDQNCYQVTIARKMPLFLVQIMGFTGSDTVNGGPAETIQASAVGSRVSTPNNYCVLSLAMMGSAPAGYTTTGTADLGGCYVRTNGDTNCTGGPSNVGYFVYTGANNACVPVQPNVNPLADAFAIKKNSIPADPCGGVYGANIQAAGLLVVISGTPKTYCGDVQLSGDVNVSGTGANSIIVIYGGTLDLNGHRLIDTGVPIIFSGPQNTNFQYPTNSSGIAATLDISAPTSGTWSGIAVYQYFAAGGPPSVTISATAAPWNITWNITGLLDFSQANLTLNGPIQQGSSGNNCLAIIDLTMTVGGLAQIFPNAQSGCTIAGLNPPHDSSALRVALVH